MIQRNHAQLRVLPRIGLATAALLSIVPLSAQTPSAPTGVAAARDVYKEYIEVRKILGEEAAAWETQKVALADMISVLKSEISQLESGIEGLKASATSADQKRSEATERVEAGRALSTAFNDSIAGFEKQVLSMVPKLPEPLVKELQPLIARVPENPASTRLSYSQRLQSVIGILAQVDKFNTDLKYVSSVQTVEGSGLEVQTLFIGLGGAIFSDATGKYSGFGYPTDAGWKMERASGAQAEAIAQAIDIYLSRKAPAFVAIPLKVD